MKVEDIRKETDDAELKIKKAIAKDTIAAMESNIEYLKSKIEVTKTLLDDHTERLASEEKDLKEFLSSDVEDIKVGGRCVEDPFENFVAQLERDLWRGMSNGIFYPGS